MEAVIARRSQSPVLEAQRSSAQTAAATKGAVEDLQQQILQQRKIIDRCKAENQALRGEFDARTKREPYVPTTYQQDKLAQLTDLIDVFTRKVAQEEHQVEALHLQIRQCQDQALQTRAHMGGINAARHAVRNHALNASQMQSRLDRALLHYHTLLTRNKALQADIRELRWERSGFAADYGKLSQQLQTVSAEVEAVVSGIDVAQTAERHAAAESEVLKAQGDSEQVAFDSQMHELKLLMAADEKLWQLRGSVTSCSAAGTAVSEAVAISPASLEGPDWTAEQEQECEEQFERMQQAGGMSSTAQLVGAYVTAEAANFELFNQVAGINTQAAQLQDLIVQQQLLIGRLRRKSDQSDPDWLVQLELSRRVSAAHKAAEQCLTKANRALHTLEEVLRALTHLVNVLPTYNQGDEYDHASAETSTVTEDNVTETLASIEQRASGILLQYASLPSLDKMSPRIGAFNTKLDDQHGALTRQAPQISQKV
ncbi:TPA: Outer dynein arm protein 1 [Trebouxia sp. C0006]